MLGRSIPAILIYMGKKWRTQAERHAFYLGKSVDKAVREHNMIAEGDRILVGISGGKDSMSLLRLLACRQRCSPVHYEMVAVHVRGDARGSEIEVPESFIDWLKSEGVPFHVVDIILPEGEPLPMNCERCGHNRRRTLFEMAEKLGCNKVALGHNLEDFAHTALMNLFLHGRLETMAFRRDYFGGRFGVIRPLAYVRERDIIRFAKVCEFPVVQTGCPVAPISRRAAAKELMLSVGKEFRSACFNIVRAATKE
ncbi:MAG: ATP-binding protein [Armatimonadota bacterium]|nr:tRNA 2-thiocytidine(32) synthetase TtcA [bacterium]